MSFVQNSLLILAILMTSLSVSLLAGRFLARRSAELGNDPDHQHDEDHDD